MLVVVLLLILLLVVLYCDYDGVVNELVGVSVVVLLFVVLGMVFDLV